MRIEQKDVTIGELVNGYSDDGNDGVVAYNGILDVRPPYQREFCYDLPLQRDVINSIMNDYPLNTMYWNYNNDNEMGIIDGQQRTLSICKFVNGDFSYNHNGHDIYYHNLNSNEKEKFLSYKLLVYLCYGNENERLDWFKIINIRGKKLTDQELRNSIYTGPWLTDAKRHFSKNNCPAYQIGKKYMKGTPIRQDYLEAVISWKASDDGLSIEEYMAKHTHDSNAENLWNYFIDVIEWVKSVFVTYRKDMKKVTNWGILYNQFKDCSFDPDKIDKMVSDLYKDYDVSNKKGIYEYILTGDEKCLNIRLFDDRIKTTIYERQNGICVICGNHFGIKEMEADHITPWSKGGKTDINNCQMLCKRCNRTKSNR